MLDSRLRFKPPIALVIVIGLLTASTLALIAVAVWLGYEVKTDAACLNIATQQRALLQQIVLDATRLNTLPQGPAHDTTRIFKLLHTAEIPQGFMRDATREELLANVHLFDDNITTLRLGGQKDVQNHLIDSTARELLQTLAQTWAPVLTATIPLRSEDSFANVEAFKRTLSGQDQRLFDSTNRLTSRLTNDVWDHSDRVQTALVLGQTLAFLTTLTLLGALFYYYRTGALASKRIQNLLEAISAGVCLIDNRNRIVLANQTAGSILGWSSNALEGQVVPGLEKEGLLEHQTPAGQQIHIQISHGPLPAPDRLTVLTLHDITEHIKHAETLRTLADHDPLTGLPNRRLFEDRFGVAVAQATRVRQHVGIALLDLDNFKSINDSLGHAVGDRVLQAVSQRLAACARGGDTIARIGGDEFVCIFTAIGGREHLAALGQRLLNNLAQPLEYDGRFLPLPVSIGLAIYPDDAEEVGHLLARADAAMYQAKQQGGNATRFSSAN
ncbi:MAG: sensor domain-containing diguanylate cyclase [Betaproteobacteria bacterium]|nr:sensor domain-containing diguanylate cyclase [Betaproteobacteria bacterium]